ncbi:MAG TPA: restriction endonuclease [Thermomicrobiaceae bacterium]|nr:restriction endonuclease [Thermomicrobiaceae bacterium]
MLIAAGLDAVARFGNDHPEALGLIVLAILAAALLAAGFYIRRWWIRRQAQRAYRELLLNPDLLWVDELPGTEFELLLAYMFRDLGYQVDQTAVTGDFGADLVLRREGRLSIVQAKRQSRPVGIKAVQEAFSAMTYYSAVEAMVISNAGYTPGARALANRTGVNLHDRIWLSAGPSPRARRSQGPAAAGLGILELTDRRV